MKCFKCPKDFTDLELYFSHIKDFHGICGKSEHVCSICFNTFMDSSRFKRHVKSCFAQRNVRVNVDIAHEQEVYDTLIGQDNNVDILNFKEDIESGALSLVLKMGAKMNFPRSEVYATVSDVTSFVAILAKGKPIMNIFNVVKKCYLVSFEHFVFPHQPG